MRSQKVKEKKAKNVSCNNIVVSTKIRFYEKFGPIAAHTAVHSDPNCKNPPKIRSLNVILTIYFQTNISISGKCVRVMFKKRVKLLQAVTMISQFHELLNLIFGGFLLLLGPIV